MRRSISAVMGLMLLAVPVRAAPVVTSPVDPDEFLPIAFKCPAENRGVLEILSINKAGVRERIRIIFAGAEPSKVAIATSMFGIFGEDDVIDLRRAKDSETGDTGREIAGFGGWFAQHACDASPQERERVIRNLEANEAMLTSE